MCPIFFIFGVGTPESGFRFWFVSDSRVGTLINIIGTRESGHRLLITGAVAAGVIAATPEGLSLFSTFLYHPL